MNSRHERRLGQRALAGSAHPPQQRVVRRQAAGEALQVLQEPGLLPLDADQAVQRQRIVGRGMKAADGRIVAEQAPGCEVRRGDRCGRQAFQRLGDPGEDGLNRAFHRPLP